MNKKFPEEVKVFEVRYPGLYMGGRAVVKAFDKESAYQLLKEHNPRVDPIELCHFQEMPDEVGVLYDWDGDY